MDFVAAVKTCILEKYINFQDRAPRSEYWWFALFNIGGAVLLGLIGITILQTLWSLALFLPGIAVSIRRLHDLDKSGWWLLLPLGTLILGGVIGALLMPIIGGIIYLAGVAILIYWFVQKGTDGANQFGPDPLA
ncbi:MAG: DUF805 domain-containing protein [Rhodobacteraceae bacterium]|nr:DUF805 domain-containing protein [Paracoccaceae bacterium]